MKLADKKDLVMQLIFKLTKIRQVRFQTAFSEIITLITISITIIIKMNKNSKKNIGNQL